MEEIKKFWSETMEIPGANWIVGIAGLLIMVLIAFYVVKLFRDMALGKVEDPTSYMTEFQKMRNEGKLDDEEYSRLAKAIPKQTLLDLGNQSKPAESTDHPEKR